MLNGASLTRREELKAVLIRSLEAPAGFILTVSGGEPNARSQAIAALASAKRELLQDEPKLLDLIIRAVPYTKDQIALFWHDTTELEEDQ